MAQGLGTTSRTTSLSLDGLEDAYDPGKLMGQFAEDAVETYQFTRQEQDAYAIESATRARRAQASGDFADEIAPVVVTSKAGPATIALDEQPSRADPAKIPNLKPAFRPDGSITAGSAASISDGAAALVLTRASVAAAFGLKPIARIVSHAAFAHEPGLFTTAPVFALRAALEKAGWSPTDVDLWEVNEAFAVVPLIVMRELHIPHERMNVNGGACALGHPLGASGPRVLTTLLSALAARGARRGAAALCIGGGEATAMLVELLDPQA